MIAITASRAPCDIQPAGIALHPPSETSEPSEPGRASEPSEPERASFEQLLTQLREAHQTELHELRRENDALRGQLARKTAADRPSLRKPVSAWQSGCQSQAPARGPPSSWAASLQPPSPRPPSPRPAAALPADGVAHRGSQAYAHQPLAQEPATPASRLVPPAFGELSKFEERGAGLLHSASQHRARVQGATTAPVAMDEPELPEIGGRSSFLGWNATTSTCSRVVTPDNGGARRTFKDIQPRAINFQMLCMENYPDREWDDLAFRQKVDLVREALKPKHWLIEPHCRPMKRWDILLAIALAFVGIVTPYEVVFIAGVDWALFAVNRAIDVIFTTDICLQFFLEVEIQRPHRGGVVMLRDPRVVRMRYLKSWFLLDLASVLPFDVLSMLLASYSSVWQQAKVLHGLRMLRLVKLLRMLRTLRIHHRWKDAIALPFCTQKLIRFCVILVLLSHWIACVWGLTGLTFGAGLCSEQGQLIHFGEAGVDAGKTSWVTTHFLSSAAPEAACNHFDVYVASLYWAVMTLTSIGYGDIVPVRLEEYVVGIGCMLAGGVLWAYAIGSVCSIISNSSPVERNFEAKADLLNLALDEAHVPHHERHKYREYLREAKAYDRRVSFGQLAKSFSPKLRKHLMYHVTQDALKSVPYFNNPETPPKLLMHLAACLVPKFFSRLESLESLRHCLCMMDRGTVAHGGRILVHPSVFHEDFVIARKMYRKVTRTISLTYTQVLVLTRDDVEEVLESHPHFARTIRVYAFKTAFCRAVHMAMLAHKALRASSAASGQVELSLTQAFDKVLEGGGFPLPVVPRIHSEPSECHGELSMRQL